MYVLMSLTGIKYFVFTFIIAVLVPAIWCWQPCEPARQQLPLHHRGTHSSDLEQVHRFFFSPDLVMLLMPDRMPFSIFSQPMHRWHRVNAFFHRFRYKSWEDEGLFGEDPPDTPSPSTFAFTNSRFCCILKNYLCRYRVAMAAKKNDQILAHLILFCILSFSTFCLSNTFQPWYVAHLSKLW